MVPSLANSSRIGTPPSSNMTRPLFTLTFCRSGKGVVLREEATYRVAQNSKVPFPFPIRVSFPCNRVLILSHEHISAMRTHAYLYANGDIREHPEVYFCTLYNFDLPLDHFLGRCQLLRGETFSLPFYSDPPFSIGQSCTLY